MGALACDIKLFRLIDANCVLSVISFDNKSCMIEGSNRAAYEASLISGRYR